LRLSAMPSLEDLAMAARADFSHVAIESPRGSTIELTFVPALESFTISCLVGVDSVRVRRAV
jgi:hypothetical protein